MSQSPSERYQSDLYSGLIQPDSHQAATIDTLDKLHFAYTTWATRQTTTLESLKQLFNLKTRAPKGSYLWGSVGIGKTYMMDTFFDSIEHQSKRRVHFHSFMQSIHESLKQLQGTPNPLVQIAQTIASEAKLLCFDEFLVYDITDATLLAGLLEALFNEGIVLVATSNTPPQDLYAGGLARDRFLPAIDLILQHCNVIHLQTSEDYRLAKLKQSGVYFSPLGQNTLSAFSDCFNTLTNAHATYDSHVTIANRTIKTKGLGSEVIWFDFDVICNLGRARSDYLTIAQDYHTVMVSNVPQINSINNDQLKYFMHLIDILYDCRVNLILQSDSPLSAMLAKGKLSKEFERTLSRLHDMQSEEYLHAGHEIASNK